MELVSVLLVEILVVLVEFAVVLVAVVSRRFRCSIVVTHMIFQSIAIIVLVLDLLSVEVLIVAVLFLELTLALLTIALLYSYLPSPVDRLVCCYSRKVSGAVESSLSLLHLCAYAQTDGTA